MVTMSLGSGFVHEEEEVEGRTMKYLPINRLYSSTSPGINPSGSSSVVSKKVKARKLIDEEVENEVEQDEKKALKQPVLVYRRRDRSLGLAATKPAVEEIISLVILMRMPSTRVVRRPRKIMSFSAWIPPELVGLGLEEADG